MIADRRTLTASGTPETFGRSDASWLRRVLVLLACLVTVSSSAAWGDPDSPQTGDTPASESLVVHRHRHIVSADTDAGQAEADADAGQAEADADAGQAEADADAGQAEADADAGQPETDADAGGPDEAADAGEVPATEADMDAGAELNAVDGGDISAPEEIADSGEPAETQPAEGADAGDGSAAAADAGDEAEAVADAGDLTEPVDAGAETSLPEDAGPSDVGAAEVPSPEADAGTPTEPVSESPVEDAGADELLDAGEPAPSAEGGASPDQTADAGPTTVGTPLIDDTQQQAILRVVFYGVYDSTTDSMDSDRARDAERAIRKAVESWWGFEAVSLSELDKRVDKVTRGFVAQSARPALRLATVDKQKTTVPGDFGLTAKLRLHEGQPMIRMRVISQPDRDPGRDPVFDDVWTEELPLEQLPRLIEMARDEVYLIANERVQLKSWPNAAIMHVPPPVAIAGKKVPLTADLLCRGECGLVLHFFFVSPDGKADAVQKTAMIHDEKTGVYRTEIRNGAAGKLRYFFTVEARDGRVLRADISTGTKEEPFEFRILAPLLGEEAKPAAGTGVPDAALQPQPAKPSPVGGAVTLALSGVVGAGAVAMGVLTHVWYVQPITEVQASEAKTFVAPVYATVGVAGALAIVGSILLSTELQPSVAEPGPDSSLDSP